MFEVTYNSPLPEDLEFIISQLIADDKANDLLEAKLNEPTIQELDHLLFYGN